MRTIRQEERFTRQLADLRINYARLDEALLALGDVLCRTPDLFPQAPGTMLRRLRLSQFPGIPPLSIFFLYDDSYVYLMSAELIDLD